MKKLLAVLFLCVGAYAQVQVAPFLNPRQVFVDSTGKPLSGGKVYTCIAGSACPGTPQATFVDNTGTTQNSNPVILDSSGSATIWLAAPAYKFVVQNSSGVQQWSVDNVTWNTLAQTLNSLTVNGNITQGQPTAATSGANQSSFLDCIVGTYWTGAASANDQWCWQDILGTGSNPTSTYSLVHSGSSGVATLDLTSAANVKEQNVSASSLEGIVYADQQTGATVTNKLDACLAATLYICVAPIGMGAGSPTSIPAGKFLWDQRNANGLNTTGWVWVGHLTGTDPMIPFRQELSIDPAVNSSGLQFGNLTETFTPTSNSKNFTGTMVSNYGAMVHYGSGAANFVIGQEGEGFNGGSGTAAGVFGGAFNAWCGAPNGGIPLQTATNNGTCPNLRGVQATANNIASTAVSNAPAFFANSCTNTGGGSIANCETLHGSDQIAGTNNFQLNLGLGKSQLVDVLTVTGNSNLPSACNVSTFLAGGLGGSITGGLCFGDGTGKQFTLFQRTGGANMTRFTFKDSGELDLTSLQIGSGTVITGQSAAQPTVVTSSNGASAVPSMANQYQFGCTGIASSSLTFFMQPGGHAAGSTCTSQAGNDFEMVAASGTLVAAFCEAGHVGVNASSGLTTVQIAHPATAAFNNVITIGTFGTGQTISVTGQSQTVTAGDGIRIQYTTQAAEVLADIHCAVVQQ